LQEKKIKENDLKLNYEKLLKEQKEQELLLKIEQEHIIKEQHENEMLFRLKQDKLLKDKEHSLLLEQQRLLTEQNSLLHKLKNEKIFSINLNNLKVSGLQELCSEYNIYVKGKCRDDYIQAIYAYRKSLLR